MGYDYLALNALRQRDSVTNFGKQIGVGKEADIYLVSNDDEEEYSRGIDSNVFMLNDYKR